MTSATVLDALDEGREAAAAVLRSIDGALAPGQRDVIATAVETACHATLAGVLDRLRPAEGGD